jgi:hypothetical protein
VLVLDKLISSIRDSGKYNADVQSAPDCILWTDKERLWETAMPFLSKAMPELLVFGEYDKERKKGPAIWIRSAIAGAVENIDFEGRIPIVYFPGVSKLDLRAVESCPEELKPVAELQYRGNVWCQQNNKDWTLRAYLENRQYGLGLRLAKDRDCLSSLQIALRQFLEIKYNEIESKYLDGDYFNTLLSGEDPIRDVLHWLNDEEEFKGSRDETSWNAFVQVCKSKFGFSPASDGAIKAAGLMALKESSWGPVWNRFEETPSIYLNIPNQIRKTDPPADFFTDKSGWPQWNETEESNLRRELSDIGGKTAQDASSLISELFEKHKERVKCVWYKLDQAPLLKSLFYLNQVQELVRGPRGGSNLEDFAITYEDFGWKIDDLVLFSYSHVKNQNDLSIIKDILKVVYLPWLQEVNQNFQETVRSNSYPVTDESSEFEEKECVLFIDGLRYDTAKRLVKRLSHLSIKEKQVWSALPSVTATGKAYVSPVKSLITGGLNASEFEPETKNGGKSLRGGNQLRTLLNNNGWKILSPDDMSTNVPNGWCEFGDLDKEGHVKGLKLSGRIDLILSEVEEKIRSIIEHGWTKIRVVTDHGWLLMPGGLPKVDLTAGLSETKWARCAFVKEGVDLGGRVSMYPWSWNNAVSYALPRGVACFKANVEYTHGGLSLQECLNLELHIEVIRTDNSRVEFEEVVWKGLRCKVSVMGTAGGEGFDIRLEPANPESSICMKESTIDENGKASSLIENDDMIGKIVYLVILDKNGKVLGQQETTLGE